MDDFAVMNGIYAEFFSDSRPRARPSRSHVCQRTSLVEVEAIALRTKG
jgi:enamine deaminase RidA (YjgF/YER057c/UK114 family)